MQKINLQMFRMVLNYLEFQYFMKSIERFLHWQTFSNCKLFFDTPCKISVVIFFDKMLKTLANRNPIFRYSKSPRIHEQVNIFFLLEAISK